MQQGRAGNELDIRSAEGVARHGPELVQGQGRFAAPGRVRDLVLVLVGRDLKLRYKRSLLGIAWSLVTPFAQLVVLNAVFTAILPLGIPSYASFLFIGILVWNWLHTSLDQATGSIVDHRELVRQPGFPVAVLPVITVMANLIHFLLALPILGGFLWLAGARPGPELVFLPVLIAIQFLLILSVAYFVATFHVTFRDTKHLLGIALMLGFYISPIFYSTDQVPARFATLYNLNPVVPVVEGYRAVLLDGTWPDPVGLLAVAGASIVLLILGYRVFTRTSHRFVDEL
jgi:lipopolysaccharide transport system permease protein